MEQSGRVGEKAEAIQTISCFWGCFALEYSGWTCCFQAKNGQFRGALRRDGLSGVVGGTSVCPEGLPIAPAAVLAMDFWRDSHPLQALHNTSVLLRYLVNQDRANLGQSRRDEDVVRGSLLRDLAGLTGEWGVFGARALIQSADADADADAGADRAQPALRVRSAPRGPRSTGKWLPACTGTT